MYSDSISVSSFVFVSVPFTEIPSQEAEPCHQQVSGLCANRRTPTPCVPRGIRETTRPGTSDVSTRMLRSFCGSNILYLDAKPQHPGFHLIGFQNYRKPKKKQCHSNKLSANGAMISKGFGCCVNFIPQMSVE